jgi:hypothetical protein
MQVSTASTYRDSSPIRDMPGCPLHVRYRGSNRTRFARSEVYRFDPTHHNSRAGLKASNLQSLWLRSLWSLPIGPNADYIYRRGLQNRAAVVHMPAPERALVAIVFSVQVYV